MKTNNPDCSASKRERFPQRNLSVCDLPSTSIAVGNTDTDGGFELKEADAGFYYILVACSAGSSYSLSILGEGSCSKEEQLPCPDAPTSFSVAGQGSGLNVANNYRGCYTGGRTYNGEDRVFVLELFSQYHNQIPPGGCYYLSINLSSSGPMGLFVFDYLCGENCVASAETPDNGGEVSITLDPFYQDSITFGTGVYYLAVDQAEPGGAADFDIHYSVNPYPYVFCTFDEIDEHEISFTSFAGLFLAGEVDSIFADFDRISNAMDHGTFYFESTPVKRKADGTLSNVILRSYKEENTSFSGNKKCAYEKDEKIIFRAITDNGSVVTLNAEFVGLSSSVTASDRFMKNGRSRVRKLEIDTLFPKPKLEIGNNRVSLGTGERVTVEKQLKRGFFYSQFWPVE